MALFLFFTKFSIFFTQPEHYTADVKMNFISLPKIKMKKKTEMIQEQEYMDTQVYTPEGLAQDEKFGKELAQALSVQEEKVPEDIVELSEVWERDEEKLEELSEELKWWDESDESECLDPEVLTRKLEWILCYVYDVYLRAKKDGEHCPTVSVGDYVFAARGFTCGHVDMVKVFKKIDKKVLFVFKKKEYVPVEVTMDIVNILAEAGWVLEPLDDETLKQL